MPGIAIFVLYKLGGQWGLFQKERIFFRFRNHFFQISSKHVTFATGNDLEACDHLCQLLIFISIKIRPKTIFNLLLLLIIMQKPVFD